MASTISFTDTVGAATLSNGKPGNGQRFANWVPVPTPIGPMGMRASDGAITRILLRAQYGCSFELRHIPIKAVSGVRLVEVAARLRYHLMNGGTCAVATGDASSSTYATCGLMPGTEPTLVQANPRTLEYTLSLSLVNLAGSPVAMICRYD